MTNEEMVQDFFLSFHDIAVVNSYILFKIMATGRGKTPMTQKKLREVLMQEIFDEPQAAVHTAAECTPQKPSSLNICLPVHYGPNATDHRKECVLCKEQGKKIKDSIVLYQLQCSPVHR
ncbi:hypothetical protein ILYODFUR_028047 [Ilyodon furcidens]|uniref:Uncharacterized protein n=1 Tax=Ilyodon furcidens TaxID=33524 RepID=A0ABV0U9E4_9TELE